tara:strand:+ start:4737 stop:5597 length:861 start_codon:yes stop_codon:yes gene_type:complete
MEKSLQQQYNLIKEGKGDKQFFLKSARYQFPDYITSLTDFNTAIHILKTKSILNEETKIVEKKNWFKIFEAEVKAHNKEMEKDLVDLETKNFDYTDKKNIDNLYGQTFLNGYYAEMKDPKNEGKTVDELKAIVAKNMAKDINYYVKNAFMGVKDIGYTQQDQPKDPKGKFKSSGYSELSEAKRPNIATHIKEVEKTSARVALEAKINAIDEAIEKRKSKLALAESEDLAEMIDKSMIKVLNKEIKELEKYKTKSEKLYEKMTGGDKEEVIDENKETSNNYNLNNFQ